jgi:hypothetical protein
MCCGKETYEEVKQGRVGLTRRKVLKAMGVGTGLITLGELTGCIQFLGLDEAANNSDSEITTLGKRNRELILSSDGETLVVSPYSWKNRMHGFDLRFKSDKVKNRMNIRIAMSRGRGITYSRTNHDLLTVRFQVASSQQFLLGEAARSISFDPLDLLIPEKTIQLYEELEAKYPKLIKAHKVSIAWNNRQVNLIHAESDKGAEQLAQLLEDAKNSSLFPLGERLYQLLLKHKDFVVQVASLFPGGVISQGLTAQDTGSCIGCGLGVFGHFAGGYLAGLACLSGIGCALSIAVFIADTIGAAISCGSCLGGGGSGSAGDPSPPPSPGCGPTCPEP